MAVGAIGLTPMSPVMSEEGKVEMPDLVRMTKSPSLEVLLEVLIRCEVVPAAMYPAGCQTRVQAWGMLPPASSSTSMTSAPLPAMTIPVDWKTK